MHEPVRMRLTKNYLIGTRSVCSCQPGERVVLFQVSGDVAATVMDMFSASVW